MFWPSPSPIAGKIVSVDPLRQAAGLGGFTSLGASEDPDFRLAFDTASSELGIDPADAAQAEAIAKDGFNKETASSIAGTAAGSAAAVVCAAYGFPYASGACYFVGNAVGTWLSDTIYDGAAQLFGDSDALKSYKIRQSALRTHSDAAWAAWDSEAEFYELLERSYDSLIVLAQRLGVSTLYGTRAQVSTLVHDASPAGALPWQLQSGKLWWVHPSPVNVVFKSTEYAKGSLSHRAAMLRGTLDVFARWASALQTSLELAGAALIGKAAEWRAMVVAEEIREQQLIEGATLKLSDRQRYDECNAIFTQRGATLAVAQQMPEFCAAAIAERLPAPGRHELEPLDFSDPAVVLEWTTVMQDYGQSDPPIVATSEWNEEVSDGVLRDAQTLLAGLPSTYSAVTIDAFVHAGPDGLYYPTAMLLRVRFRAAYTQECGEGSSGCRFPMLRDYYDRCELDIGAILSAGVDMASAVAEGNAACPIVYPETGVNKRLIIAGVALFVGGAYFFSR